MAGADKRVVDARDAGGGVCNAPRWIIYFPENWRRPSGQPRGAQPCRMKNIHDDLPSLDLGIHEARDLAQNRPHCRLMSAQRYALVVVHAVLLHPHLRHCSSPASAVRRLPSAVRTATPAFHVRSSGLLSGRPGGLELVTRLPARSVTFL